MTSRAQTPAQLKGLQRFMARAVMRPLTRADRMQSRWANGKSMRKVAAGFIKPNERLTSFERLEIYNRQYWYRVLDAFREDYPGLRAVLGGRKFEALRLAYLTRHPSTSFTLRNLGRHLESFLCKEARWAHPHETLALDMARFEWAQVEAFDGAAKARLREEDLRGRDPAGLRLHLQPYIQLLECRYPVDDYLMAVKRQGPLRGETSSAVGLRRKAFRHKVPRRPRPEKIHLVVHRLEESLYYKRVAPEAWKILVALQKGVPLGAACARAIRGNPAPRGGGRS